MKGWRDGDGDGDGGVMGLKIKSLRMDGKVRSPGWRRDETGDT